MRRGVLGVIVVSAWAAPVVAADAERQAIGAARHRIEAEYAARDRECRAQFVVSSCLDDARATRREGLAALQVREAEIDDHERRRRAAARQAGIDEKQRRRDDAPAPLTLVPAQESAAEAAARDAGRTMRLKRADEAEAAPASKPPTRKTIDEAAQAAQYDARLEEARQRKEAAARREAERQKLGKAPAAPLPPVVGASQPAR